MNPKVQQFIGSIEKKEVENGKFLYKIVTIPKRLCPLGYFDSEDKAIEALEKYLTENRKI
jgi:hypothetical protein